jgi:hypothetical protein
MKRLLLTLLCLLFAYPCFAAEPIQLARMNPYIAAVNSSATCSEGHPYNATSSSNAAAAIGYDSSYYSINCLFTTGSSPGTVVAGNTILRKIGSPVFVMTFKLCGAGSDDAHVDSSSCVTLMALNASDISSSDTSYSFSGVNDALSSTTKYHIVVDVSSVTTANSTNYISWRGNTSASGYTVYKIGAGWTSLSTWNSYNASTSISGQLLNCSP